VLVVDHLRAFLSETPGFDRLVIPMDKIRNVRLPAADVSVKEVILGKSTPGEFLTAAEWVKARQRQTQNIYGVTVLATSKSSASRLHQTSSIAPLSSRP
jgi:hypothetical protein